MSSGADAAISSKENQTVYNGQPIRITGEME
jgi:hypothetical protein